MNYKSILNELKYSERNDNPFDRSLYTQFDEYQLDVIDAMIKAKYQSLYFLYEQWFQGKKFRGLGNIKRIAISSHAQDILERLYHFVEILPSGIVRNHIQLVINAIMYQLIFKLKSWGNGSDFDYLGQLIKDGFNDVTDDNCEEWAEKYVISNRSVMRGMTFNLSACDSVRLIQRNN